MIAGRLANISHGGDRSKAPIGALLSQAEAAKLLNTSRSNIQRAMVGARLANMKRGDNQHAQICATSQAEAAKLLNVSRRSVQHAMVGARLANLADGQKKEGAPIGAKSQAEAAKLLNVSRRSVQHATVVRKDGVPELQTAVESGSVVVSALQLGVAVDHGNFKIFQLN